MRELTDLETAHPELLLPDSPTQRVGGAAIDEFVTVEHRVPMLSIDNTYNADELRDFDRGLKKLLPGETIEYVVELKIDGVAMSLTYESGRFTVGVTRGDGERGNDSTHNLRTISDIPLQLRSDAPPTLFEARGEVYMARAEFVRVNRERVATGEKQHENPRNLASGTLKLLDPKQCAKRRLSFFAYATGAIEGLELKTHMETLEQLRQFGFSVNPHSQLCPTIEDVITHCDTWNERRHDLPYDTDGMVIKVNDLGQRRRLGTNSKFPRWARAYKFAAEQALTKLERIAVQVGRTGKLTPVAYFDPPVRLAGTTVSKCSVHNADYIVEKDIRIGDMVLVEKAGEIIPQIVRVETSTRTGEEQVYQFPAIAPCVVPRPVGMRIARSISVPRRAINVWDKSNVSSFNLPAGMRWILMDWVNPSSINSSMPDWCGRFLIFIASRWSRCWHSSAWARNPRRISWMVSPSAKIGASPACSRA